MTGTELRWCAGLAMLIAAWGCGGLTERNVEERPLTAPTSGGEPGVGGKPGSVEPHAGSLSIAGSSVTIAGAPASERVVCADGQNVGLIPHIMACPGSWKGEIDQAQNLCATGWHVCQGTERVFNLVTYADARSFPGCFAYDAANDNNVCQPHCSAQIGRVDSATGLDMAGMGADCNRAYYFADLPSCLTKGGRIDASENDGVGCNYDRRFAGVVCCEALLQ